MTDEAARDIAMRAEAKAIKVEGEMAILMGSVANVDKQVALLAQQMVHMKESTDRQAVAFELHNKQNSEDHQNVVSMYREGNMRVHARIDELVRETGTKLDSIKDSNSATVTAVITAGNEREARLAQDVKDSKTENLEMRIKVLAWAVGLLLVVLGVTAVSGFPWQRFAPQSISVQNNTTP